VISLENVVVRVGGRAFGPLDFHAPAGGYTVLTGPSGSGKTTLVEAIVGLRTVTAGRIVVAGVDVTRLPPAARGIGYAPQDAVPFPRLTVGENLAFALRVRGADTTLIAARVTELASDLGLTSILGRRAVGLSGGEAQRLALGRAVAHRPAVLVLDEPLNALDAPCRDHVAGCLRRWHARDGFTALHVTHHPDDAVGLATTSHVLHGHWRKVGANESRMR